MNNRMAIAANTAIVAGVAAIIVVSVIVGAYLVLGTSAPLGTATLPGLTTETGITSTDTTNSTLGLELEASIVPLTVSPGGSLLINVSEYNALPAQNNVSAASHWAIPGMTLGGCGTINYPFGIAIFSGNYETNNISSVKSSLLFYYPGAYSCPALFSVHYYDFSPSSSNASLGIAGGQELHDVGPMSSSVFTNGTWTPYTGGYPGSVYHEFAEGIYTVAVGDEWGQLVMLHFNVESGSTTTQSVSTSSSSCQAVGRVNSTISTGGNTIGGPIAYDSHDNEIYATGTSFNYLGPGQSNYVYAINPSTNTSTATIAVGNEPTDIAYDPNNNNLYVTNFGSNSVSVISDSTNAVTASIPVGAGPIRIAYNPYNQYLYVSNRNSGTLSVIDPATNSVISNITVSSSPFEIAYDSFNHDLYVTDGKSGNVTIISSSNKVVGSFSIGQGSGMIAYDSANNDLYFFPQDSQVLYIIDGSNNSIIGNVSRIFDLNAIGYDPVNENIYVAGNASGGFVDVISGSSSTSSVISSITGEQWVPVDFAYGNGSLYLGTNYGKAIFVLSSTGTSGPGVSCVNPSYTAIHLGTTVVTIRTTTSG